MPDYRRHRVPGGTCFFTINLLERRSDFLTRHINTRHINYVLCKPMKHGHTAAVAQWPHSTFIAG